MTVLALGTASAHGAGRPRAPLGFAHSISVFILHPLLLPPVMAGETERHHDFIAKMQSLPTATGHERNWDFIVWLNFITKNHDTRYAESINSV